MDVDGLVGLPGDKPGLTTWLARHSSSELNRHYRFPTNSRLVTVSCTRIVHFWRQLSRVNLDWGPL